MTLPPIADSVVVAPPEVEVVVDDDSPRRRATDQQDDAEREHDPGEDRGRRSDMGAPQRGRRNRFVRGSPPPYVSNPAEECQTTPSRMMAATMRSMRTPAMARPM